MLLTQSKAAETFSISRAALSLRIKRCKENGVSLPGYYVRSGSHLMIETDHPEWLALMDKRNKKGVFSTESVKKTAKPVKKIRKSKPDKGLVKQQKANLEEARVERQLKNEMMGYKRDSERLEMQKKAGNVIDFDLATFLFFGYMERMNVELLNLKNKIAPMIENLVKEGDFDGVLNRYHKEHQKIVKSIMKAQAKDSNDWEGAK